MVVGCVCVRVCGWVGVKVCMPTQGYRDDSGLRRRAVVGQRKRRKQKGEVFGTYRGGGGPTGDAGHDWVWLGWVGEWVNGECEER